jgi:hypothetical protein
MAKFVTPQIKQLFTDIMADLRSDIGRDVTIIAAPTEIECPNCGYDPVRKCSNNRYEPTDPYPLAALVNAGISPTGPVDFSAAGQRTCPVCQGKGRLPLPGNRSKVVCLINELTPQDAELTPLGKRFKVNYELQTAIAYKDSFANAQRVIVDGTVCEVVRVVPQGIGDLSQVSIYAGGGV